jgi:hypothetical protein
MALKMSSFNIILSHVSNNHVVGIFDNLIIEFLRDINRPGGYPGHQSYRFKIKVDVMDTGMERG